MIETILGNVLGGVLVNFIWKWVERKGATS